MKVDKIKKLKDLRLAYECAINYDYVPNVDQANILLFSVLPVWMKTDIDDLERVLTDYEGNSPNNITNLIINSIDEL